MGEGQHDTVEGTVEIYPEYAEGLEDLEGFSHIVLIYHFHLNPGEVSPVGSRWSDLDRSVFATRSPSRPNPIGISTVSLLEVEGRTLRVGDLDVVDGTPLLDIKPYIPKFDLR